MITINEKSMEDIHREIDINSLEGIKKEICLTYITDFNGVKIDTNDLSENKIISLITYDLMDFFAKEGSYQKQYRTSLDAFKLAPLVRDRVMITVNGAYELYRLIPTYGEIMFKILNDFGYMPIIQRAIVIAKFIKESHNDFNAIAYKEMITVLEQMANNESEREYNIQMRLK